MKTTIPDIICACVIAAGIFWFLCYGLDVITF